MPERTSSGLAIETARKSAGGTVGGLTASVIVLAGALQTGVVGGTNEVKEIEHRVDKLERAQEGQSVDNAWIKDALKEIKDGIKDIKQQQQEGGNQ